jgi:chromate transport protein ChrA
MNREYQTALKESSVIELEMARQMLTGRRNLAVVVAVIAVIVILSAQWSFWTLLVAGAIWFATAGQCSRHTRQA